jgi:hypothetical protein
VAPGSRSRTARGRSADPLARNGASAGLRFPFRNRSISGPDRSRPPVLGRQAWPEVGRSPERRNIDAGGRMAEDG